MKTLEIFSGTKSFSKVMAQHGHETLTIDNNPALFPDLCGDLLQTPLSFFETYAPEVIWASPPCTAFSVASIGTHWGGGYRGYEPKTEAARLGMALLQRTLDIIDASDPQWWFIENPRGVMRKMPFLQDFLARHGPAIQHTITYCQYGDHRMKPTDIWTNAHWWTPRTACKNGDTCHEAAPRGSKTGTQGIKGAKDRGRIPPELFEEILAQMPVPSKKAA